MLEKTIAKPLSGLEVKEAILDRIRKQMNADCTLRDIEAYGAFSFYCTLTVNFQTLGATKATSIELTGIEGEVDPEIPEESETITATDVERPPNEVRRDSGQGIPVLTKDEHGHMVEKTVNYRDPEFVGKKAKK